MNDIIRFAVLGSGSQANAYVITAAGESVLIDNGFSGKELLRRLGDAGIDPRSLKALLVTHDHHDHIRGVETLVNKLKLPVFLPRELANKLPVSSFAADAFYAVSGEVIRVGSFEILPFETYHDSEGSLGYSVASGGKRLTVITDTGRTNEHMAYLAGMSDVLFLESNYCPDMLKNGSYPMFLKQRISSARGHLSNHDACEFLSQLAVRKRSVYFCHLSAANNSPQKVLEAIAGSTKDALTDYIVCSRGEMYCGQV